MWRKRLVVDLLRKVEERSSLDEGLGRVLRGDEEEEDEVVVVKEVAAAEMEAIGGGDLQREEDRIW